MRLFPAWNICRILKLNFYERNGINYWNDRWITHFVFNISRLLAFNNLKKNSKKIGHLECSVNLDGVLHGKWIKLTTVDKVFFHILAVVVAPNNMQHFQLHVYFDRCVCDQYSRVTVMCAKLISLRHADEVSAWTILWFLRRSKYRESFIKTNNWKLSYFRWLQDDIGNTISFIFIGWCSIIHFSMW